MRRRMAYGGGGLSADGAACYGGMFRSVKVMHFEGEGWVDLWKEIRKEEQNNDVKGKQSAKRAEVWQEKDPEKETTENLFENGNELYKDTK